MYDVLVIGAGPGGYATALRTSDYGLRTAIIEKDTNVGGTCLNRGCIPTKAFMNVAHTLHNVKNSSSWGVDLSVNSIDMSTLKIQKDKTVTQITKGLANHLKSRHIDIIHGTAKLLGAHKVEVSDLVNESETSHILTAHHIVIATGSQPATLPHHPFYNVPISSESSDTTSRQDSIRSAIQNGEVPVLTSDDVLDIDIPIHNVTIVGSGAIALEFATIWNSLGAHVTILARKDTVLSRWEAHISSTIMRIFKREGIKIETYSSLQTHENSQVTFTTKDNNGNDIEKTIPADFVLVAVGRNAQKSTQSCNESGIEIDDNGFIIIDENCHTNLEDVWALGDVTGGYLLAHQAFEQALVISENIMGHHVQPVDFMTIPQVVFGIVDAVSIGYSAQQAIQNGFDNVTETVVPQLSNPRVAMIGSTGTTVIVSAQDKNSTHKYVVGVHIVGPQASEYVCAAREIIQNRISLSQAARALCPHPTISESLGEALLKADGKPLHVK